VRVGEAAMSIPTREFGGVLEHGVRLENLVERKRKARQAAADSARDPGGSSFSTSCIDSLR
jgi:hypothetical protein